MTERKTKLVRIEHQQKFQSIKEAEKEANAICGVASRAAKKNNWSCKLLVAVSENDPRNSQSSFVRNGRRGRPIKTFVAKYQGRKLTKKKPHLHIILYGYPGQAVANKIVKNINIRYRKRHPTSSKKVVSRSWQIDAGYIPYVVNQSSNIRCVNYDPDGILSDLNLLEAHDKRII